MSELSDKIDAIAEELRTTRYEGTDKLAFEYVFEKHKDVFHNDFGCFLRCMKICATFFSSRDGEYYNDEDRKNGICKTMRDRLNTRYTYVKPKKQIAEAWTYKFGNTHVDAADVIMFQILAIISIFAYFWF